MQCSRVSRCLLGKLEGYKVGLADTNDIVAKPGLDNQFRHSHKTRHDMSAMPRCVAYGIEL